MNNTNHKLKTNYILPSLLLILSNGTQASYTEQDMINIGTTIGAMSACHEKGVIFTDSMINDTLDNLENEISVAALYSNVVGDAEEATHKLLRESSKNDFVAFSKLCENLFNTLIKP